ncbi:MAG: hypothetical protein LBK82_15755 [Planctomycetaceae bacterium]|jgi:hypothetical protein|nr:hypothetical protein [Planctomycetaceae bacterium]
MRLSLRTLLAFEDHIFDQEQHQQLERLIPKHDAASTMLNRIRSTVRNPRLGVPGLVDQREELDPNLVAEYLDHQMPEEVQERFETYCLSSDKYLAEITSIHHVLSNVLGEPARTSRECRQHCYDLYRLPVTPEVFREKQEKERKESELPFGSRKLSFDDYLPPPRHSETSKPIKPTGQTIGQTIDQRTESNEFQVNRTSSSGSISQKIDQKVGQKIDRKNRPELVAFQQQHETYETYEEKNLLPSFNIAPFPHLTSAVVPAQTDIPEPQTAPTVSASVPSAEQKNVQPFSLANILTNILVNVFGNWLTAGKTEKNKTENKTENRTEYTQINPQKNNSLWTVLMIFLLCSTVWLGWNKVQEKWNNTQHKNETALMNTRLETTDSASEVSEPSNVPEKTTTTTAVSLATATPPIAEVRESATALPEPPKKSIEIIPSPTSVLPTLPQQPKEELVQPPANTNININTNIATESLPQNIPPVTELATATKTATEFQPQPSDSVVCALPELPPSTSSVPPATTATQLKSRETPLSNLSQLPEKPMSFAPNPMRHSQTVIVPTDSSESQSFPFPPADSPTQTLAEPAPASVATPTAPPTTPAPASASTSTPAKRREKPQIRNSAVVARVTPTNFETPVPSKPLLVAMPEREPEQFDDQSLIAFQPISAPPKQKNAALLSAEFVEPKRHGDMVSGLNLKEPQNPNAWMTSVVNQIQEEQQGKQLVKQLVKQPVKKPAEQSMERLAGQSEPVFRNELTDHQPKQSIAFGNAFGNTDHLMGNAIPNEPAAAIPTQHVIPVGEIREKPEIPQPPVLGRVLAVKEPCIVFSASTASDQWEMKRLPLALHADQYLLTTSPFRAVVELESGFLVEMVGDSKFCLLEPDENGIAGVFIDYGRLVIRPIFSENKNSTQSLRLQTEKIQGTVHLTNPASLIFVDTFAEILENTPNESTLHRPVLPQTRPILGLIPEANGKISWQVGQVSLAATRQAGVLLVQEKPELGNIQGLPNWLNPLPLPPESEQLAAVCHRIFDKTDGNCEAALNLLIREPSIAVRSFGYRLWGDLGRFDIPLTFLSEAKPDEEPIRQVLVPYFREVMKRDEETVQRLADAIETVRH